MYPECRHVRASGQACHSPALAQSNWCYFHSRLYENRDQRPAAYPSRRASLVQRNPPRGARAKAGQLETIDYGAYPVGPPAGAGSAAAAAQAGAAFYLPPVEDTESVQLALIEVLQALAANQIDAKRAGLLLYGLQVASANAKNLSLAVNAVRTISHTEDGAALAPQDYGFDIEDYDAACEEEEKD